MIDTTDTTQKIFRIIVPKIFMYSFIKCREITNVNNGGNSVFYGNTRSGDKQKELANAVRAVAKRLLELDISEHTAVTSFEENREPRLFDFLFKRK